MYRTQRNTGKAHQGYTLNLHTACPLQSIRSYNEYINIFVQTLVWRIFLNLGHTNYYISCFSKIGRKAAPEGLVMAKNIYCIQRGFMELRKNQIRKLFYPSQQKQNNQTGTWTNFWHMVVKKNHCHKSVNASTQ